MKRFLVALLMGTMILAASGCGKEGSSTTTAPAGGGEAKTEAGAAPAGEKAAEPAK